MTARSRSLWLVLRCTGTGDNGSINVEGVLLSLVGSGASSVMATVTTTGDVRLPGGGNNRVTVIDSVVDPLTDDNVEVGQKLTLTRHTGEPSDAKKTVFHLVITEAHVDSFDGGELKLKFSGIPDDIEIVNLDAWVTTKKNFDLPTLTPNTNMKVATNAPENQVPVSITTDNMGSRAQADADEDGEATVYLQTVNRIPLTPSLKIPVDPPTPEIPQGGELTPGVDVVVVLGSIKGADDEDLLPIDLDIQVSVDLGPIGDDDDDEIPRFASDRTTAMTVIDSSSAQTKFLVPYAVTDGAVGGYDTGFSIANTTSGPTAQSGPVTFSFPGDATLEDFESGMVGPGQNLTMLLSEILGRSASLHRPSDDHCEFHWWRGSGVRIKLLDIHLSIAADQG